MTEEFFPDDANRYHRDDAIVARTGQPRMGIMEPYQLPSGERRWVQTDKIPLKDEDGKVTGVLVFAQDVTGRKLAEEALRASEERLRLALAAGQMGAWDIDLDTGAVAWDAAQYEIFGQTPTGAGVTMEDFYAMLHPDDVTRVRGAAAASRSTGRFREEFRIVRPDGRLRWILGQGVIISDEHGRPVRMVGVNDDITDRKEAQARIERFAEELERTVAERTSELVHSQERLRALAAELTLTEQRERNRLATELHDHLQQLLVLCKLKLGQGKRVTEQGAPSTQLLCELDETISQALTYSRSLVAELSPPVLRESGLVPSLRWLSEWMRQMNLEVMVEGEENSTVFLAEAHAVLLFQSVRELLINAAKYAGTGRATVRLRETTGWLRIDVEDEGKGFDVGFVTGAIPSLGGSPLSSKFGLLSIRERMTALGGSLQIVSTPEQGTTATLLMPLTHVARSTVLPRDNRNTDTPCTTRSATMTRPQAAVPREKGSIRVLLADDHAMMRQGLRSVLDAYPDLDVVGEASDGEEAVVCVERLRPSVVVMDINMPRKDGIDATAVITSRFPDTAVIGLSVNAVGPNAEAMQKAGACMVLTKEAAVEHLYDAIQKAING
jgi:PAS domain S-box-containing protein